MAVEKQNWLKQGRLQNICMELESTRNGGEKGEVFLCVHFQEELDHAQNNLCLSPDISKAQLPAVTLLQTSTGNLAYK